MDLNGFKWWRKRLEHMARYFDAYRIDHILGFFRIWEIPYESLEGVMGNFNPALPFNPEEIQARGIPFNEDRFCKPYLPDHILVERLGERKGWVIEKLLVSDEHGKWSFRKGLDNQRAIKYWLKEQNELDNEEKEKIKEAIFSLLTEVIFLPDKRGREGEWYPRFAMQHSRSFQELDGWIQHRLNDLYHDYYFHRHEKFWAEKARVKLPAIIGSTNMLVCGEDLGFVPSSVPGIMEELGILSLEIQRMPKQSEQEFFHPANAPYLSVVSPSSHDVSPLRAWWEENRGRTQSFFNHMLGEWGEAPNYCEPWIIEKILDQHFWSPAMWAIFPIQDLLALDYELRREVPQEEQINDPSISQHYWRFRLHIPMEDLLKAKELNQKIYEKVLASSRNTRI